MHWVAILAERKIEAARLSGVFDDLPGEGKPLPAEALAGEWDPGHYLLRQAGFLPEWLELRGEIGLRRTELRASLSAGESAEKNAALASGSRDALMRKFAEVNRLIEAHNLRAPSLAWQLPRLSLLQLLRAAAMHAGEPCASGRDPGEERSGRRGWE